VNFHRAGKRTCLAARADENVMSVLSHWANKIS
jgi:hypothetical protein